MPTEHDGLQPSRVGHSWDGDYETREYSPVYVPLWRMLEAFLGNAPSETVLDFGCGDGTYACLMGEKGRQVTGIDISEKAIQKAGTRKCEKCIFIRCDCIPNDLPGDSFDVVVALNSLHCLTHDQRAGLYEQIRRVLKPNGYFFAGVLSVEDESYPRREWREIAPGTFVDGDGKLFHFFTESELADELSWLETREIGKLQNIHPGCGRKSALFVVAAQYPGPVKPEDVASKKTTSTRSERIRP